MSLQIANRINVFDVIIIEKFNDANKPCFSKYRVSRNKLSRVLFDYQTAGYTIIGVYPLEETVGDDGEDIDKLSIEEAEDAMIDNYDGM